MKMDKEQKAKLIGELSLPWGQVELMCDGFRVSLQVRQEKPLKYVVAIWVNGKMNTAWCDLKSEHPEKKFLRLIEKSFYSAAKKAELIKAVGKRCAEKDFNVNGKFGYYVPVFITPSSAINQILKVSERVEVLQVGHV